jgi:hypothetical protein
LRGVATRYRERVANGVRAGRPDTETGEPCGSPHTARQKLADHAARNSGVKKRRRSVRRCVRREFELPGPVAELAATGRIVDPVAAIVKRAYLSLMRQSGPTRRPFADSLVKLAINADLIVAEISLGVADAADVSKACGAVMRLNWLLSYMSRPG